MSTILSTTDFIDKAEFYGIPDLRFPKQIARLTSTINFAETKFLIHYSLTTAEINAKSELKEALKYFTFASWLRLEWLEKTPSGASVEREQTKGQPKYDLTREVEALNTCTDLVNNNYPTMLVEKFQKLKPFLNY